MADYPEREYVLTIKRATEDRKYKALASSEKDLDPGEFPITGIAAYGIAKNMAFKMIDAEVNRVQLKTGSTQLQEKANWYTSLAKRGFTLIESIATGAVFGGGAGAIVGAGVNIAMQAIDIGNTLTNNRIEQGVENVSIQLNNIRIGSNGARNAKEI